MAGAFKPRNILFVLLATVVFLIIGMAFAGVTGAGKNQGLAGGAIVFGYGVTAALIALVASVRVKPLTHASPVMTEFSFLVPIRVADQWAEVRLVDDDLRMLGKGWIRWRDDGKILVSYSLLS